MHFYWKYVLKILDGCFANKQLLGVFVASLVFWGGTVSLGKHCPLRLWLEAEVLTHPEWFIQGAHIVRSEVRVPLGNVFLTFEGRAIFASSALLSLHSWVEVAPLGSCFQLKYWCTCSVPMGRSRLCIMSTSNPHILSQRVHQFPSVLVGQTEFIHLMGSRDGNWMQVHQTRVHGRLQAIVTGGLSSTGFRRLFSPTTC